MGAEFRYGVEVGRDVTLDELRAQGFKAFYVAIGCQGGRLAGIPGEDAEDVTVAVDFLREVNSGKIDALPGRKIILKGNHDYWWGTATKMKKFFEANGIESIDILFNNCFFYGDYALCGTRGWFYEEDTAGTHTGKMLAREALRLEASFKAAGERPILCFLHYPPLYQGYRCPELLELIDRYRAERCYYGHLHGPTHRRAFEGRRGETDYALVSADYLGFVPKKICD